MAGLKLFGFPIFRYRELLKKANASKQDKEKRALLYILSKNRELYEKSDYIYDFDRNLIKAEVLENTTINLSSDARKLIIVAFNLFNGFTIEGDDALSILDSLEDRNFTMIIWALKIRFSKEMQRY